MKDNIINEKFSVGDKFIGMIDKAKFLVVEVGKEREYIYQNKNTYVTFLNIKTGRKEQTILENAQRLLLKKECFQI